ncbi:aldose epimerase family protein [Yinghuangia sp. YIM S09857]|uniref:aldose epimerase family protein n=1 Tax=Yinghuangia sp. YIM S09857 TaxID=3436929 RepID=UPI003F53B99D
MLSIARHPFGTTPDGTPVHRWVLEVPCGVRSEILTYGGILHRHRIPDRDGVPDDVVLSLPSVEEYAQDTAYLGALVGRYANRIADARFPLDGVVHHIEPNEGANTLHGGPDGFHRRVWSGTGFREAHRVGVVLRLHSPHGDMGFPGNLDVEVTYTLDAFGTLTVTYRATTDRPTVVNLTQHAYWNLSGAGPTAAPISGHELTVNADAFLPVAADGIPLGFAEPTAGSPFALAGPLGDALRSTHPQITGAGGLDHCFVLQGGRAAAVRPAAHLSDPASGRALQVWTTEPGLQVYTANHLGKPFSPQSAVCLETQNFPDAPNRADHPTPILRPGDEYHSTTEHRIATRETTFTDER